LPDSRVIVLTEVEQIEGAERSVLALSRWLQVRRLAHRFVTYVDHANIPARAGYPVEVVQLRPGAGPLRKAMALRSYFAEHASEFKPLASGYQAALHATLAGQRGFHCLMHDTPSLFEEATAMSAYQRGYRWVSNRIVAKGLRSGGRTMVTSEFLKTDCLRLFGVQAEIARMGGFSAGAAMAGRRADGTLRMLSVSRIEENKRIDWMLRALARMEMASVPFSARVDWRLDIAGRGSRLDAMKALAASLGVAERVTFHGYVSDDELPSLYAEAHLFLMPAVQGYGIPAIEALERGMHVLVHRESGVSDVLLETPWATVMEGGEEAMLPALGRAIQTVLRGEYLDVARPGLPSEHQWAERVARLCGWT
jgi:glycosyltransferase involved in cell wall biosynthesis